MSSSSSGFGASFGGSFGAGNTTHNKQIISDVLRTAGIDITNTTYRNKALVWLNNVYFYLLQGKHWTFTNFEQSAELIPPYSTGRIDFTQDSDIITEYTSATVPTVVKWNAEIEGQIFAIDSTSGQTGRNYYRINRQETMTRLQLTSSIKEATSTNKAYEILYDRYQIDSSIQDIKSLTVHGFGEIKMRDAQWFRRMKEDNPTLKGTPEYAAIVDTEYDSGQMTLELFPSPDERYTITMEASRRPVRQADSETSFSMIPPEHTPALHYAMLAELYRDQNNQAMLQSVQRQAAMSFNKMAADFEVGDPKPRIQMGQSYFGRRGRRRGYYGNKWFPKVDD